MMRPEYVRDDPKANAEFLLMDHFEWLGAECDRNIGICVLGGVCISIPTLRDLVEKGLAGK